MSRQNPVNGVKGFPMRRILGHRHLQSRYMAVWYGLVLLVFLAAILARYSLGVSSLSSTMPLIAFLYIAAMGQTLVIMTGGIDLSIPSVITIGSVMMMKLAGRSDAHLLLALVVPLSLALAVGLANGLLVTLFNLNPLVVTLAVGAVVTGVSYVQYSTLPAESGIPPALSMWAGEKVLIFNHFFFLAIGLGIFFALAMNYTTVGRRFVAAGTNPNAAKLVGIRVKRYQIAAYTVAGLLYGLTTLLLAAFVRSPDLSLGNPYLLSTVVVVVLGGASLSGGPASMIAAFGGAIFVTFLNHMLRALGFPTSIQVLAQGIVLVCAMGMANLRVEHLKSLIPSAIRLRHAAKSDEQLKPISDQGGRNETA